LRQFDLSARWRRHSGVVGLRSVDVLLTAFLMSRAPVGGDRLDPLIPILRRPACRVRAALEWLKAGDPDRWAKPCDRLLGFYSDVQLTSLLSPTDSKG